MARLQKRSLSQPDDVRQFSRGRLEVVDIGDVAVGRTTCQPGWRWSQDVKPIAGTELCEMHHAGYVISGTLRTQMRDGSAQDINALLIGSGLNTVSRGSHSLKGIAEPVELFAVG